MKDSAGLTDLSGEGLNMMAMGDLDNDKHVDLVTTNDDQNSFTAHYYNAETFSYTPSAPVKVDPANPGAKIASIVISKDIRAL